MCACVCVSAHKVKVCVLVVKDEDVRFKGAGTAWLVKTRVCVSLQNHFTPYYNRVVVESGLVRKYAHTGARYNTIQPFLCLCGLSRLSLVGRYVCASKNLTGQDFVRLLQSSKASS